MPYIVTVASDSEAEDAGVTVEGPTVVVAWKEKLQLVVVGVWWLLLLVLDDVVVVGA